MTWARIIGIDPGNDMSGVAIYDVVSRRLVRSISGADLDAVRRLLVAESRQLSPPLVAIEQMQSYGIAGGDLLLTAAAYGRILEYAETVCGLTVAPYYRREVCSILHVTGKNKDTVIKHRLCEMHGTTMRACKGTKTAPGVFYGLAGHAWQALAVAVAAADTNGNNGR